MNNKNEKSLISDKEYRRKLYEENKESYKKMRTDFLYGVSDNFRSIRKASKTEIKELEEETNEAFEEME